MSSPSPTMPLHDISPEAASPPSVTADSPTVSPTQRPSWSPAPSSAPTLIEEFVITQIFHLSEHMDFTNSSLQRAFEGLMANYTYAPGMPAVSTTCSLRQQTDFNKKKVKIRYVMRWASRYIRAPETYKCAFWYFINDEDWLEKLVSDMKNAGLKFVERANSGKDFWDELSKRMKSQCSTTPTIHTSPPTLPPTTVAPVSSPTFLPSAYPTYFPTDTPTDDPTISSLLLEDPSVSIALYRQDFQLTEARRLNEMEQVLFEHLIASYTPSYGPSKSTAFGKVNTSCEIMTQTLLESTRMLRADLYNTRYFSTSHRGTKNVTSKLRIIYNVTWVSVYLDVSESSDAFANFINGNLTLLTVDLHKAGLTLVDGADPVEVEATVPVLPEENDEAEPSCNYLCRALSGIGAVFGIAVVLALGFWVYSCKQRRKNELRSEKVEPMNRTGAQGEKERTPTSSDGRLDDDITINPTMSPDAGECHNAHGNSSNILNVAEKPPPGESNLTGKTGATFRKGEQSVSDAATTPETMRLDENRSWLEDTLTPPSAKGGLSPRHRRLGVLHQSMPEGGFSFLSSLPEALSAAAALLPGIDAQPDVDSVGREVMRKVICSPESDPLPISLPYLQHCTGGFSEIRRLGEGSSSEVYLGKDTELRRKFAVKKFRLKPLADIDAEEAKKVVEREIRTLKIFRHPNIARLYAYHVSPNLYGRHCLVFELASKGSLYDFLKDRSRNERLHWTTRINIAFDVAKALEYLHKGRAGQICYHRDVKSSNICLKRDFTALLIDCGVSTMIPDDDSNATISLMESFGNGMRGTPGYICPEYSRWAKGYRYGSANDVFSLGIVFAEIFTGLLIGSKSGDGNMVDHFKRYIRSYDAELRHLERDVDESAGDWDVLSRKEFAQLTLQCISPDPGKRPRVEDIVQRLGELVSKARPRSPGERNRITVLSSGPLAFRDKYSGELCPFETLNFRRERDLLVRCLAEAGRCIDLNFDVATDDRLHAAVTKRCGCLHFSGHGNPSFIVFEDGAGGAHVMDEEKLHDCVHAEPFKFVFVSACDSLFMGRALVKAGVPHVVCCEHDMQFRDSAAIKFTHSFYFSLAEGYTVKASFEKAKTAVSKRFHQSEVDKFVLLPEDGEHDRPLFIDAEKLEWKDEVNAEPSIPLPPQYFLGRQLDMYNLLQLILSQPLVTLIGGEGVGCSSLASAICHYISERKTTILGVEAIYFVRSRNENQGINDLMSFIKPLHDRLVAEARANVLQDGAENASFVRSTVDSLADGGKSLVVFDGVDTKDAALSGFVKLLFEATNTVKLLLTARMPMNCSSCPVDESVFTLGPLNRDITVDLFTKLWQQKGMATVKRERREVLKNKVESSNIAFDKIGGGFPARTIRAANKMSKEQFDDLITAA